MIKIFADTAMPEEAPDAAGYTTNPTIIKNSYSMAGLDYSLWARDFAKRVSPRPVSFEVIADDFDGIMQEALALNRCGPNIYVKIPIVNSEGVSNTRAIVMLNDARVKINVTAVLTADQVCKAQAALCREAPAIISIFSGRIADTGVDPVPLIEYARKYAAKHTEILWASAREIYNVYQAEEAGADIITLAPDLIKKLQMRGYDLHQLSIDTARQFRTDALAAGLKL